MTIKCKCDCKLVCSRCKKVGASHLYRYCPECRRKMNRVYSKRYKDKIHKYNRAYYLKNKKKLNKRSAKWMADNPDKAKMYNLRWQKENKGYLKRYYKKNRVKILARIKMRKEEG